MKKTLKWFGITVSILFTAFAALIIYGLISGDIQAKSIYQEYQYNRLSQKLSGATDKDSILKSKVLAACDEFFGKQRPDDAYHCYEGVFKDQKRRWVLMHAFDETAPQGLSATSLWATIWSTKLIFRNDKIYGSRVSINCDNDHFIAGWDLLSTTSPKNQSLFFKLNDGEKVRVEYGNLDKPNGIFMDKGASRAFITAAQTERGYLTIWIPDENGDDLEFRFNLSKLPRKLSELKQGCGL